MPMSQANRHAQSKYPYSLRQSQEFRRRRAVPKSNQPSFHRLTWPRAERSYDRVRK